LTDSIHKNSLDSGAVQDLLGRIANGSVSVADWNSFSLQPFTDRRLEKIRRRIVDCAMTSGQCSSRPASPQLQSLATSILAQWDWWYPDPEPDHLAIRRPD